MTSSGFILIFCLDLKDVYFYTAVFKGCVFIFTSKIFDVSPFFGYSTVSGQLTTAVMLFTPQV